MWAVFCGKPSRGVKPRKPEAIRRLACGRPGPVESRPKEQTDEALDLADQIGIGCGVILLIGILLAVAASLFTRDTMRGIDGTIEARTELDERFGETDRFTPWPDGAIPAERMETFLQVREGTARRARNWPAVFSSFPPTEDAYRNWSRSPSARSSASCSGPARR